MASSSSISSSEQRPHAGEDHSATPPTVGRGAPVALLLAFGLLAIIEIGVRLIEPSNLIAYERGAAQRTSTRLQIEAYGSPEVVFVGSSRVHVGIVVPRVREGISRRAGRTVSVANFASGGALVQELSPLLEYMLRHRPLPKVVLYGVDPEQIARAEMHNERAAVFWNWSDWWRARATFGPSVDDHLPIVVRNHIADWWWTFRYRAGPYSLLKQTLRGRDLSPIRGDLLVPEHTSDATRSLVDHPADADEVRQHVESVHLQEGRYPFNLDKVRMLEEAIKHCRDAGVQVVLFEVPNAGVFNRWLPPDAYPLFYRHMRDIVAEGGARFVSLEDLGLKFTDAEFRDPVHLNFAGACRLSDALVDRVLAPGLPPPGPSPAGPEAAPR